MAQLTWKPYVGTRKGGRWGKRIQGKSIYFGTARSRSDRAAYAKALERYRDWAEKTASEQIYNKKILEKRDEIEALGMDPNWAKVYVDAGGPLDENGHWIDSTHGPQTSQNQPPQNGHKSISKRVDDFLAEEKRRHQLTMKNPASLSPGKRLGVYALSSITERVKGFNRWVEVNNEHLGDTEQATEAMLRRYRKYLDDMILQGTYTPQTVSNKVQGLKRFVKWLWERRHIETMPRGLNDIFQKYQAQQKAKSLTVPKIKQLWKHSSMRQKAFVAICLNCGMYPSEVAQLRGADIKNGYIAARRPKTGVAGKWKLWKITEKLINETRNNHGDDQLVWQTRNGLPLIHASKHRRTDTMQNAWKATATQAKVEAKMSQFRDTAATYIEKIGKRTGNTTLVSQMLRHADGRTAKYYIDDSDSPHDLNLEALDAAVEELGEYLSQALTS